MRKDADTHLTVDLFADEYSPVSRATDLHWPDARRFPLNLTNSKVEDAVLADIHDSASALLVTGYASLDRLIDFASDGPETSRPRLLIGHEPHPSRRQSYELTGGSLPREVEHYWLQRGISLHLSAKLLRFIQRLKDGHIQVRYMAGSFPLHAKIYVGDRGATLGSSNFSIRKFRKSNETGDVIGKLTMIAGRPPKNRLSIALPEWLTDAEKHRRVCEQDRKLYEEIYRLHKLSPQRERQKARRLISLLSRHDLLLAFDGRPITLALIRQHIQDMDNKVNTILATGDGESERSKAMEAFQLGSEAKRLIGLCSDSLSEGVNLQQASVLVHLDMPTVVRIAEQRVGRVDRMDSPHAEIEAWWPEDAPAFALTSDERFVERYETVESLLGSNMPLPQEMQREGKQVDIKNIIADYEKESALGFWDGIQDAFEPVRGLVQGEESLVDEALYERYRHIKARVLSRVSLVKAEKPWAFFCLNGGAFRAPRWLFIPSFMGQPVTELAEVCVHLREALASDIVNLPLDEQAVALLDRFLGRLDEAERTLLPRKKQRALEEMRHVVGVLAEDAAKQQCQEMADHYSELIGMLDRNLPNYQPDWDEVAGRWLDVIRPVWFEMLNQPKRQKPLLLKDIRKPLLSQRDWLAEEILTKFREFPVLPGPEERIRACIIGVA